MVKNKLFLFVFLLALLMLTTASSCGSTYTKKFLFIVYGEKEFTNIKCSAFVDIINYEVENFELIEHCFGCLIIATTKPNEISEKIWMKIEANNYDDTLYAGAYIIGCLLYTSDAADDTPCVDLGGRRIIKKKTKRLPQKRHGNVILHRTLIQQAFRYPNFI
eukprot:TRINITY_DN44968_c0_g1_i2.p3 TRINITY_DN44968_c0_g1~~TRINITY_DN44968_c0_g1_i2.p3  ORF type:complete len:162 (+),score=17.37 TRINITY_DN44968_c0_g1_i2:234-719(+)